MMRLIFKTSSVTLDFFYVFNLILSFSTCSESFEKVCSWELLGVNVLKTHLLAKEISRSKHAALKHCAEITFLDLRDKTTALLLQTNDSQAFLLKLANERDRLTF